MGTCHRETHGCYPQYREPPTAIQKDEGGGLKDEMSRMWSRERTSGVDPWLQSRSLEASR